MLEGVLDVSWTCDQSSVLGAGNDKSIRVWDPTTGRVRHTMTGHTGKVGCCDPNPNPDLTLTPHHNPVYTLTPAINL